MIEIDQLNQVAFATLAVIGLMLIFAYILKKIKLTSHFSNKKLSLLGTLQVGSKEKVLLINVEGKKILIGATPTSIQTLWAIQPENEHVVNDATEFSKTLDQIQSVKGMKDACS